MKMDDNTSYSFIYKNNIIIVIEQNIAIISIY